MTILRHSRRDGLLVLLALIHGALLLAAPSLLLIAIGVWWSSNTVSHNFIHRPFFSRAWMNAGFSLYLSALLGIPQTLWRRRHLRHHGGRAAPGSSSLLAAEVGLVLAVWSAVLLAAPEFFLTIYAPAFVMGLALCWLHGHFEHAGGTTSHYGPLYNLIFFNDGYHAEHHLRPGAHWTRLPSRRKGTARESGWPPVLRWLDALSLESLERLAMRSARLQGFLLRSHERAMRALLHAEPRVRNVAIIGGGCFPRSALILRKILPHARIVVIDAKAESIERARPFCDSKVEFLHAFFDPDRHAGFDLVVVPLSLVGSREDFYREPPAPLVLVHDWIWSCRGQGERVSVLLLKRLNLVRRAEGASLLPEEASIAALAAGA